MKWHMTSDKDQKWGHFLPDPDVEDAIEEVSVCGDQLATVQHYFLLQHCLHYIVSLRKEDIVVSSLLFCSKHVIYKNG